MNKIAVLAGGKGSLKRQKVAVSNKKIGPTPRGLSADPISWTTRKVNVRIATKPVRADLSIFTAGAGLGSPGRNIVEVVIAFDIFLAVRFGRVIELRAELKAVDVLNVFGM